MKPVKPENPSVGFLSQETFKVAFGNNLTVVLNDIFGEQVLVFSKLSGRRTG